MSISRFCRIALLLSLGLCRPAAGWPHALLLHSAEGGVGIQALYDDGRPAAFCDVEVIAPDEPSPPFVTGMTDKNGCYFFRPDRSGAWRVKVDDGVGHVATIRLELDAALIPVPKTAGHVPRAYGIVTGIALIFGIFGWWAFLRARASVLADRMCRNPNP